jgi:hypothetical protein
MQTTDSRHVEESHASREHDIPRNEPWLGVLMASFVPTLALFVIPDGLRIVAYVLIALLLLTSIAMLVRNEITRKAK